MNENSSPGAAMKGASYLKWFGLLVVVGVNLLVFGDRLFPSVFSGSHDAQAAFRHFSEDHSLNQSPFSFPVHFMSLPDFEMQPVSPLFTTSPSQYVLHAGVYLFLLVVLVTLIRARLESPVTDFVAAAVFAPPRRHR